jgi:hypothetical protein
MQGASGGVGEVTVGCCFKSPACCCTRFLLADLLAKLALRAYVETHGRTFYRGPLIGTYFSQAAATGAAAARSLGGVAMILTSAHIHTVALNRYSITAVVCLHTTRVHPLPTALQLLKLQSHGWNAVHVGCSCML